MRILLICLLVFNVIAGSAQKMTLMTDAPFPYEGKFYFNSDPTQAKAISAFKGQNVIIDLFSSNCVVCFQMLPKINALQKQYYNELKFLLIGFHDQKIEVLYDKFKARLNLTMDVAFDSLIFQSIQVNSLPTYIWINKAGIVEAVTGPSELTEENVTLFINGHQLPFAAVAKAVSYDSKKPYLLNGNGGDDKNFLVRTVFGKWSPSMPYFLPQRLKFLPSTQHFNVLGAGLNHLYNYAYWGKAHWEDRDPYYGKIWLKPIVLDYNGDTLAIKLKDLYCYGVAFAGKQEPDLSGLMRKDLEAYFGYSVYIETHLMPCYLVRIKSPGLLRSSHTDTSFEYNHAGFSLRNMKFNTIIQLLAYYSTNDLPFLDESNIDYRVSIDVDALLTNQEDFFSALEDQGVIIERSTRPMKILVLRKKNSIAAK